MVHALSVEVDVKYVPAFKCVQYFRMESWYLEISLSDAGLAAKHVMQLLLMFAYNVNQDILLVQEYVVSVNLDAFNVLHKLSVPNVSKIYI